MGSTVFQLKITLKNIRPHIWRRVQVPSDSTFNDLHCVIQGTFGWCGYHCHQFTVQNSCGDEVEIGPGIMCLDDVQVQQEKNVKLSKYFLHVKQKGCYKYDVGDDWDHEIVLEKILPKKNREYPWCMAGKRACPPEDCGGPWVYKGLLKILADPNHEEHAEMKEWMENTCMNGGANFDPEHFDINDTNI